jgi:hypothetical protein
LIGLRKKEKNLPENGAIILTYFRLDYLMQEDKVGRNQVISKEVLVNFSGGLANHQAIFRDTK